MALALGAALWTLAAPAAEKKLAGENSHHILEAAFKGAGRALADAVRIDAAHRDEIPSTKGLLV